MAQLPYPPILESSHRIHSAWRALISIDTAQKTFRVFCEKYSMGRASPILRDTRPIALGGGELPLYIVPGNPIGNYAYGAMHLEQFPGTP